MSQDRQAGLPLLVDDETNAYLHADGALAELDGSGQPTYLLDDALGSVRGLSDLGGSLTGTADYDVFGQVRASSGASSVFGFTGEQFDAETGFTFLRARYLDPRLGRFLSADSVQPNAPGTQGFNLYAYVANNPTTWVDPSGHMPQAAKAAIAAVAIHAFLTISPPIGLGLIILLAAPPLICALDPGCRADWWEYNKIIEHYGSEAWEGAWDGTLEDLVDAEYGFPENPRSDGRESPGARSDEDFWGCLKDCFCPVSDFGLPDWAESTICGVGWGAATAVCGAACATCAVSGQVHLCGGCIACLGFISSSAYHCVDECV